MVVFFAQVSICSNFGVMRVAVTLLELLAGLIASLAEDLTGWEVLQCQIASPSPLVTVNEVDLAHMLCITTRKPGGCVLRYFLGCHQSSLYPAEIYFGVTVVGSGRLLCWVQLGGSR